MRRVPVRGGHFLPAMADAYRYSMEGFNMQKKIDERLHTIPVRLYPSYLPTAEGKYLARIENDPFLSINEIGASMKNRGGFTGSYEDAIEHVRLFLWECMYKLADGFGVNLGYFSLVPHVGGTFSSPNESQNDERHPVTIKYRRNAKMKEFTDEIAVVVKGLANCTGWLDEFTDIDENETNSIFVPGNMCLLKGNEITAEGPDPSCGVFFADSDNPSNEVRMTRIAKNSRSEIIGICPNTTWQHSKIVIRTQFMGYKTKFLKTVRVIESSFIIEKV